MVINSVTQRSRGAVAAPELYLDDLPVDVFELEGSGLTVESMTGGHGMPANGASSCGGYSTPISCICSCVQE